MELYMFHLGELSFIAGADHLGVIAAGYLS